MRIDVLRRELRYCGCIMDWERIRPMAGGTMMCVDARNFDPAAVAGACIRLLDGAPHRREIDRPHACAA